MNTSEEQEVRKQLQVLEKMKVFDGLR